MKRILIGLIIMIFGLSLYAQDREVEKSMKSNYVRHTYNGVAADSLTVNQDTLDIIFVTAFANSIRSIHISSKFDLLSTTDTIVKISILGEGYDTEGYSTLLAESNSAEITADNQYVFNNAVMTEGIASYTIATLLDTTAYFPAAATSNDSTQIYSGTNTVAAQTITPVSFDYKRIVVRFIYPSAGDYTGSGVDLDELKIRFWTY